LEVAALIAIQTQIPQLLPLAALLGKKVDFLAYFALVAQELQLGQMDQRGELQLQDLGVVAEAGRLPSL